MTETIDTAQPEALRIAAALEYCDASVARQAINELRRLQNALEMAVNDAQRSWRELAAAEARNATLTDDAARYRWLREQGTLTENARHPHVWRCVARLADLGGEHADEAIDAARAAASISTKGDGHG